MKPATTAALLKRLRGMLEDGPTKVHAQTRLAKLRGLEETLLEERIFAEPTEAGLPDRGELSMKVGVHPSQASRIERRLITRTMAIVRAQGKTVGEPEPQAQAEE